MNRVELVERIATSHDLPRTAANRIIDDVFKAIIESVKSGDGFSYVGFGSFKQASRAARTGRNPRTGEDVQIPARNVPKFVAGAAFKAALETKPAAKKGAARKPAAKAGATKAAARPAAKKAAAKK